MIYLTASGPHFREISTDAPICFPVIHKELNKGFGMESKASIDSSGQM
jgi:hypothetical protein